MDYISDFQEKILTLSLFTYVHFQNGVDLTPFWDLVIFDRFDWKSSIFFDGFGVSSNLELSRGSKNEI